MRYMMLLLISLMLIASYSHAQWTDISYPTANRLYCVQSTASGQVWIGGINGILRSTNGGSTLNFVNAVDGNLGNAPIFGSFDDIHVTGTNSAVSAGLFFLGNDLIMYGTGNNGSTWTQQYYSNTGSAPRYMNGLAFNASGFGLSVGSYGRVLASSNNGSSWSAYTSGLTADLKDIAWTGGSDWVMASDIAIYRSINNGLSWTQVGTSFSTIERVSFAPNSSTGYAGGYGQLQKSSDGGQTWSDLRTPPGTIRSLFAFSTDSVYVGTTTGLYRSISGGQYWESFTVPGFETPYGINFYDGLNGLVVGDSGFVAKTTNGGGITTPVSQFEPSATQVCDGSSLVMNNYGNPSWTYQWLVNGVLQSTQYAPTLTFNTPGVATIQLVSSANGNSDTTSVNINVIVIPAVNPFTVVNDSICQGGTGIFYVNNSQQNVNYALFDGTNQIGISKFGTGGTLTFLTAANQTVVKPYRIRGVYVNACGADTLFVEDSLYIAIPAANVSALLYRDTICTSDTTSMLVYNSEPGWEYYCSNATQIRVQGNGGTILIPVGPITSNVTITVNARFIAQNCLKTLPGSFPLRFISSSASIVPGTLQGAPNQPITISASSTGYNTWLWNFGQSASPSTGVGSVPGTASYNQPGIDTVTLTLRLDNTCERVVKKAVYVYSTLAPSTLDTCSVDTGSAGLSPLFTRFHMDPINGFHIASYNVASTPFPFIPYVVKFDSTGKKVFSIDFFYSGNNPGAQGLPTGITSDRLGNTYASCYMNVPSYFNVQGNYLRHKNALIKIDSRGNYRWGIESNAAVFTDLITIDNRVLAIGYNAWNGAQFQTPNGGYTYAPAITNRGDAFVMEISAEGKVLGFDAFGGTGNAGVSAPAKFRPNLSISNGLGGTDTLRRNLMAVPNGNGSMLIGGFFDASSLNQPIVFNQTTLSNALPLGTFSERTLFIARYNLQNGFSSAVTLLSGSLDYLCDFKEDANGNFVVAGRVKNKIVTSAGTRTLPIANQENQFLASFTPAGTLNWMVLADSMLFRSISTHPDGSVTLTSTMTTKFLIVDAANNPVNVSPSPSSGSFLLRFNTAGELVAADRISSFQAMGSVQDACGNIHSLIGTTSAYQVRPLHTVHSINGNCVPNCNQGYDPNLLDAGIETITLNDTTAGGAAQRSLTVKLRSHSVQPITSIQVACRINNDPVQFLNWSGSMQTADSLLLTLTNYTFNRNYNRIRVWISSVNNGMDDRQENDSVLMGQIVCQTPLAGTYSLGCDTCYFDSFQSAANTLRRCGVSASVLIAIEPGTYYEQVAMDSIPGAGPTSRITWTSANGDESAVTLDMGCNGSFERYPLLMRRAHYCTIDGITIRNTIPRALDALMNGSGSRSLIILDNVQHTSIRNCRLFGAQPSAAVSNTASLIFSGGYLSNITIENNTMEGGDFGIYFFNSIVIPRAIVIRNNTLKQTQGINLYNCDSVIVDGNRLTAIGVTSNSVSTAINLFEGDTLQVINNLVSNESFGQTALNVKWCNCPPSLPCLIANNSIGSAPRFLSTPGADLLGDNFTVVHNSFGQGVTLNGGNNLNFANNLVRSNGSFVITISSFTGTGTFNNNRYQSSGFPIAFKYNGNNYTLAAWRTLSGYDSASDSVTASYNSLTDMHLRSSVSMPGIPWPGITTDIDGEPRSGTAPTIGADEFSPSAAMSAVWPGDCDSSTVVDNFDYLPIGLLYNRFGTSRPEASTVWAAQPSLLWSGAQTGGVNLNHADANGDGVVTAADTIVIVDNLNSFHATPPPPAQRLSNGPELIVSTNTTVIIPGDTVTLTVSVGSAGLPVYNLSAIGFQVPIPASLIQPGSFRVSIDSNWICPDAKCLVFNLADETNGIAAISIARIDGSGPDGYDTLATISFIVSSAYSGSPIIPIHIGTYQAYDPASTFIPLNTNGVQITFPTTNTSFQEVVEGLSLFPNPANNHSNLQFRYSGSQSIGAELQLLDLLGRTLFVQPVSIVSGPNTVQINTGDLTQGVYLVRLVGPGLNHVKRLVKTLGQY
ncbi:MAG: T9SS type A sorting domain-containing protein [Sphingobacteriales bacterium]|nr:T9SS type A sorting domain-containing protein [Sphingobacteriales bacterium]